MEQKTKEVNTYYRFQIFLGDEQSDGTIKKTRNVGMAYLSEGQSIYTIRLWTFSWDRYYILPDKNDSSRFLLMTREASRSPQAKNKYYWNIVGNAVADSKIGLIRLDFDLIDKPIFMSIHPETSPSSRNVPYPDDLPSAA